MTSETVLPRRAEDAVAKLKRSRDETTSPGPRGSEKRAKTVEAPGSSAGPEPTPSTITNTPETTTITSTNIDAAITGATGVAAGAEPEATTNTDKSGIVVDSSSVLDQVSGFTRRVLGSVVYRPNMLIVRGHELQYNGILQVKIGHQFLSTPSEAVKQRAVWGTDVYTDDTDVIAALHHLGYLGDPNFEKEVEGKDLLVELLLLPTLQKYTGSLRNNLNSRTWLTKHDGISYMVLGKPKAMAPGWAHAGKNLLYERYKALRELREWDSRNIAYV